MQRLMKKEEKHQPTHEGKKKTLVLDSCILSPCFETFLLPSLHTYFCSKLECSSWFRPILENREPFFFLILCILHFCTVCPDTESRLGECMILNYEWHFCLNSWSFFCLILFHMHDLRSS
ncbi:uncharacterized protein BDW70DRAFT_2488 [Aspergillus foveolatus]|uniref:uncharacterized protein n=1 Tax=Aspergillus foveolatus TaxID=210207 RepID=UPI003CCD03E8